jgi:hypothetical protein
VVVVIAQETKMKISSPQEHVSLLLDHVVSDTPGTFDKVPVRNLKVNRGTWWWWWCVCNALLSWKEVEPRRISPKDRNTAIRSPVLELVPSPFQISR